MDLYQLNEKLPDDLLKCVEFHGHLCPGLVYGYLVAKKVMDVFKLDRSKDEETVAISENDSCSIDALQVLLGTTTGKGNLILKDYGKNAFTILIRSKEKAVRFSRKTYYEYNGEYKDEFKQLDKAISDNSANNKERWRHKFLKAIDLLLKPVEEIFFITNIEYVAPPYAPLARSELCVKCGEMTMLTKMVEKEDGTYLCRPCASTQS